MLDIKKYSIYAISRQHKKYCEFPLRINPKIDELLCNLWG